MLSSRNISSFILICLDSILNTYTSPENYIAALDIELKLNYPQVKINSESDIAMDPLLRKPDIYIADLEQLNLNVTIANFREKTTFNPKAKFIFFIEKVPDDQIDILIKFFISNVIFINQISGEISTYSPYKNKAIHYMDKKIYSIGNCSDFIGNKKRTCNLFENKIPKTWNDSMTIFCYLFEPPYSIGPDEDKKGLNFDIFEFIAGLIGLNPIWNLLVYPENGDLNSFSKNSVMTNEICDLNTELFPVEGADFTHPHVFDELPFFVPNPSQIPRWQYLLKCLTIEIWMFWFFVSLILSLSWSVVLGILEKRWNLTNMLEILWLNVEYFIEKSHEVSKKYRPLKMLSFLIVLQSLLLNMVFKSNFNFVLSGIIFEKSISSLQDIVDRRLVFGLFQVEELENILEIIGDKAEQVKYATCDSSDFCFNRTAFVRDMAVHQSLRVVEYIQNNFLDENGSPLMVKVEPSYMEVGLCAILPLGHPLTFTLDKYILLSHAYGFNEFFVQDYDHGRKKKIPLKLHLSKLTLDHIMTPSALLICGYITGSVMFLLEIRKCYKKKQSKWGTDRINQI